MDFIKRHRLTILGIVVLSLILIIFTIPFRKNTYIFDWDQANDYQSVAKIAQGKLALIGPRVTSDTGFFLSPWHYYFLLPFFKLTNGDLFMGFWAAFLVQFLFVITSFLLAKKWFGTLAGFTTGIMVATSSNLIAWGFMYIPLISLIFFYFCLKTIDKPKLLPFLFLLFGFGCTTYAVFYALIIPFGYVVIHLLIKKKVVWQKIVLGMGLAILPYSPLIIFDLRHNFLNIRNILGFAGNQQGQGTQTGYFLKVFYRALEVMWLNRELPTNISMIVASLTILILVIGTFKLFNKKRIFVFLWLVSSLIPMSLYKGNVSEYYYAPVILLIPFFISGLLVKKGLIGKILLIYLVLLLSFSRLKDKYNSAPGISLADKIEAVNELEKLGTKYSVSYEFNIGEDNGYGTVLTKVGKNYVQDGSSQLYTLTYKGRVPTNGKLLTSTERLSIFKR